MWKDMDTEQQGINGAKIFVTGVTVIPHLPAITIYCTCIFLIIHIQIW